jgi:hypothetical protein
MANAIPLPLVEDQAREEMISVTVRHLAEADVESA